MGVELERAYILFEQSRHDLAEQELRQELACNPESASAHALLALCLSERALFLEAIEEAGLAIRLAPDLAFAHYALASIQQDREQLSEAGHAIQEAIRLDPEEADYHALLASIRFDEGRWTDAKAAAEEGLRYNPEHVICSNLRAMVFVKLGRLADADAAMEAALTSDPQNAVSHANQGWVRLRQREPVQALEHFRAALHIDPDFEMARQGIVEAMKARFWIYQILLRFFVWMGDRSGKAQWAMILGGFCGYWGLRYLGEYKPTLAPLVTLLLAMYILFGILTWIAYPLFNLLLRFDAVGRLALTRDQALASNWVGGCLLASLVGLLASILTHTQAAMGFAIVGGLMVLPITGTFRCRTGLPRRLMIAYTALVAGAGVVSFTFLLVAPFLDASVRPAAELLGRGFIYAFVIGAFFSGLVTIGLMMLKTKRLG